jgi:hypothetical protein
MPLDDQVFVFLQTKGNLKFSGAPHPRLFEYNKLSLFWDKLGLNRFDLEKLHPDWISDMYLVILGSEKHKNSLYESNKNSLSAGGVSGKKKIEKLL